MKSAMNSSIRASIDRSLPRKWLYPITAGIAAASPAAVATSASAMPGAYAASEACPVAPMPR